MWSIPEDNTQGRAFVADILVFQVIAILTFGLRVFFPAGCATQALDRSGYACILGISKHPKSRQTLSKAVQGYP